MENTQPTQQDRIEKLLQGINTKLTLIAAFFLVSGLLTICKLFTADAPWWH